MGHPKEWSVPAYQLTIKPLGKGLRSSFGVDTCPEREVLFRVWAANRDLETFEMEAERAIELAEQLLSIARTVIVRNIMES